MDFDKTDLMTGLDNRSAFEETLTLALAETHQEKSPLSVMFINIDNFEHILAHYGHLVAEDMLGTVGHIWKGAIRQSDSLSRIDEGRFGVIMPSTPTDDACNVADILRQTISHHVFVLDNNEVTCSASIGVAGVLPGETTIRPILSRAESALSQAMEQGGVCCSSGM